MRHLRTVGALMLTAALLIGACTTQQSGADRFRQADMDVRNAAVEVAERYHASVADTDSLIHWATMDDCSQMIESWHEWERDPEKFLNDEQQERLAQHIAAVAAADAKYGSAIAAGDIDAFNARYGAVMATKLPEFEATRIAYLQAVTAARC